MKGHIPHDAAFQALISDSSRTVAVLWPDDAAVTVAQLRANADAVTEGRVTLIGVDATWNGARNMIRSYGDRLIKVRLDSESIFAPGQSRSLLAPVRKYRLENNAYSNRACTLEAVAAALAALEDAPEVGDVLRGNLKRKVNALLRQNGEVSVGDLASHDIVRQEA